MGDKPKLNFKDKWQLVEAYSRITRLLDQRLMFPANETLKRSLKISIHKILKEIVNER